MGKKQHAEAVLGNLSAVEQEALVKLKDEFKDADYPDKEDPNAWFSTASDLIMLRFLRARDFDYKKTVAMLKEHLEWRCKWRPHEVSFEDDDVKRLLLTDGGSWRMAGRGKEGHPIVLVHSARFHPGDDDANVPAYTRLQIAQHERFNRFMVREEPMVNKATGAPIDSGIVFLEMSGYSHFDQGSPSGLKYTRILVDMALHHYPETLFRSFVYNAPVVFRTIWNIISPWFDEHTRERIVFVKDKPQLLNYVDADQLLEEYGGSVKEYALPV